MEKYKKRNLFNKIFSGIIIGILAAGVFMLGYFSRMWLAPKGLSELEYVLKIIEKNYDGEFDVNEFISGAVSGSLDQYSSYYTPTEYEGVEEEWKGNVYGRLGMSFYSNATVYSVEGNSPAERAGIVEGGRITHAKLSTAEEFTEISSYEEFQSIASAAGGEEITLKILYKDGHEEFTLRAENYNRSYVWYQDATGAYNFTYDKTWTAVKREKPLKTRVNGNLYDVTVPEGAIYIRFSRFMGNAVDQLEVALSAMGQNKKLILDLRDNGGGDMRVLTSVADMLVAGSGRRAISVVKYKAGDVQTFYSEASKYYSYGYESITVLANSGTASASEALIGAMLDFDAAEGHNIIKVRVAKTNGKYSTYGKGIMQTTFENSLTGSAIKLTTAHIYWPKSGKCIHGTGISPEVDGRVIGIDDAEGYDAMLKF